MPSIWEDLYELLKKEPFSSSMQIQKEKRWKSWRKRNQYGVFSVKKIEQKEKDFILNVKINNFDLDK